MDFYIRYNHGASAGAPVWEGSLNKASWDPLDQWVLEGGEQYELQLGYQEVGGPVFSGTPYIVAYFQAALGASCNALPPGNACPADSRCMRYGVKLDSPGTFYPLTANNEPIEPSADLQLQLHSLTSDDPKIKLGGPVPGNPNPSLVLGWQGEGADPEWEYDDDSDSTPEQPLPDDCIVTAAKSDGDTYPVTVTNGTSTSTLQMALYRTVSPGSDLTQGFILNCNKNFVSSITTAISSTYASSSDEFDIIVNVFSAMISRATLSLLGA